MAHIQMLQIYFILHILFYMTIVVLALRILIQWSQYINILKHIHSNYKFSPIRIAMSI